MLILSCIYCLYQCIFLLFIYGIFLLNVFRCFEEYILNMFLFGILQVYLSRTMDQRVEFRCINRFVLRIWLLREYNLPLPVVYFIAEAEKVMDAVLEGTKQNSERLASFLSCPPGWHEHLATDLWSRLPCLTTLEPIDYHFGCL